MSTTSSRYPRYLTFSPQELEDRYRELGHSQGTRLSNDLSNGLGTHRQGVTTGRSRLIKSHTCPVQFPDGKKGVCHYSRGGPAWHVFKYDYSHNGSCGYEDEGRLSVFNDGRRLTNTVAHIEQDAQENAAKAYADAIEQERRGYFMRATEMGFRKKRPERFQMRALRAKALSGKYAVCCRLGKKLLPISGVHDKMADANEEWRTRHMGNTALVVACCNRLDRCWELPNYNPLYAVFDPRPIFEEGPVEPPHTARAQAVTQAVTQATTVVHTVIPKPAGEVGFKAKLAQAVENAWQYLPGPEDTAGEEEDEEDEEDFGNFEDFDVLDPDEDEMRQLSQMDMDQMDEEALPCV